MQLIPNPDRLIPQTCVIVILYLYIFLFKMKKDTIGIFLIYL